VKLKPPAFLMLGMVRLGASSGYAIKKAADASTRFFWPTSLAQVYPELARLESAGLLRRRDDPQGARNRSAYELTSSGEEALLAWLRSPQEAPTQFRDEGILRLFFADALPAPEQRVLVRRLRERAEAGAGHMRADILPQAKVLEQAGVHYPLLAAQLGADTNAYVARWLARLEARLENE
jgi:DNA-binding PadR family transcriptional regulator